MNKKTPNSGLNFHLEVKTPINEVKRPEGNDAKIQAALNIAAEFQHGLYQHYKGGLYTTLHIAIEEASVQPVVVYRSHENGALWTRPWAEFTRPIETAGQRVPRFSLVQNLQQGEAAAENT